MQYDASMNKEPVIGLTPLNDCVLVELKQSSKNFNKKEGKYDTRTEGIVVPIEKIGVSDKYDLDDIKALFGKTVHFEEFKEGARIRRNGKLYSFIKIEDLRGYEDAES